MTATAPIGASVSAAPSRRERAREDLLLILKIGTALVLCTAASALLTTALLYRSALEESDGHLVQMANTTAALVASVAAFDRLNAARGEEGSATDATLRQVRGALNATTPIGATDEITLIGRTDTGYEVVALRDRPAFDAADHGLTIEHSPVFAALTADAFAGLSVSGRLPDIHGHTVHIALAPVAGTQWAVVAERHHHDIAAPFWRTTVIVGLITALIIAAGTVFTRRAVQSQIDRTKRAEQRATAALADKERTLVRFQNAIDASQEGFSLFDADRRLVMYNKVYQEFHKSFGVDLRPGITLREIMEVGVANGAFPEAAGREEEFVEHRIRLMDDEKQMEVQLGDGRWFMASDRRTRDGDTIGIRTDITKLKEREFALRQSEERFRTFTESASDWIWETDAEHRFIDVGRGRNRPASFDPRQIVGLKRWSIANEDTDTEKWWDHIGTMDRHQPFRDFRYWIRYEDGTESLLEVSGTPRFDAEGAFLGYRGTGRDVTEEENQIKRLRDTETLLRATFESVTSGLVVSDRTGTITEFNQAASRIFGYAKDDAVGRNVSMLTGAEHRSAHDRYISAYQETGTARIIGIGREVTGRRKDGTEFPLNLGIAEMSLNGQTHYIASIVDISAEKDLEAQLRQSQKLEAVGQLAGGMAHDFNNILAIISGNSELIERRVDGENERVRRPARAVREAAARGAALIERLLDLSRRKRVKLQPVDINAAISGLRDLIEKSLTTRIDVRLDLAPDGVTADTEPSAMEDALINLCINARDAMDQRGTLTLATRSVDFSGDGAGRPADLDPGRYVRIDVTDTGSGMSPQVLNHALEPFYTTKEQSKGSGLGLPMVLGFAKRSGGGLSIESKEGFGTTVSIFLPETAAESARHHPSNSDRAFAELKRGNGETILIVDDEVELTEISNRMLSEIGYRTLVAHDAAAALTILERDREIALLITDLTMPGAMNGLDLAREATRRRPGLKVCIVTGFASETAGAGANGQGFPVLTKPYALNDLADTAHALLTAGRD